MNAPLVTPSRDALAKALFAINEPIGEGWADRFDPSRRETYLTMADALLASGVVRAVDTLVEDEALVEAISADQKEAADSWGQALPGAERSLRARTALRALAAALDAR